MSQDNFQGKVFLSFLWGGVEKVSLQLVTFVIGIILARLLSPADYGLIAMTTVFVAISQSVGDAGFSAALIRKQDRTELDYSTVFLINILLSAFMCGLLVLASPYIADFYKEPLLKPIICLNGLYILLLSFLTVQSTRLLADLQFKQRSIINIITSLTVGVISLIMAYSGLGVWSLVYPQFVAVALGGILHWKFQHWFPKIQFSIKTAKEMFSFGSKLMLSNLLDTMYNNLVPIVIGKKMSSAQLGLYSRAQTFSTLPSTTITGVLAIVVFPVLSQIQSDDEKLYFFYRRMLRMVAYIVFPLMTGVAVLAHPLVITLVTAKWEQSVVLLQVLSIAMALYPIHGLNLNLLQVKGRSDLFLKLEVIKKVLGVLILIISMQHGVIAICLGILIHSVIALFINTHYTGKILSLGFFQQMKDLLPSGIYSLLMGVIIYFTISLFHSSYLQLTVGFIVGVLSYLGISLLTHSQELQYCKHVLKQKLQEDGNS